MNDIIKPKTVGYTIDKFAHIIGIIPSSYKYALTYEEQIFAIGEYLEKVVFPAINDNAEALAKLQGLFLQLKDYVDNYFDNLDVQEEINNKLDDMVTQGTMAEIINQEIFGELNEQVQTNTENIASLMLHDMYVDVVANGIANDGTNVTEDLQDLIDEYPDGATFYFKNGTYLFKNIELNSNTKILGDTDTNFIINDDLIAKQFIIKNKNNIEIESCNFQNGTTNEQDFIGSTGTETNNKCCIYAENTSDIKISNCKFNIISGSTFINLLNTENVIIKENKFNHSAYCQLLLASLNKNITIENNEFKNAYTGSSNNSYFIATGVINYTTDDGYVDNLHINNNLFENNVDWEAIDSHGATNVYIENNKFVECYIPINIFDDTRPNRVLNSENININNNFIKAVTYGVEKYQGFAISVQGNSSTLKPVKHGSICNNTIISNSNMNGINIRYADDFKINNNYCYALYSLCLYTKNLINSEILSNLFKETVKNDRDVDFSFQGTHNTIFKNNSNPSSHIPPYAGYIATFCNLFGLFENKLYWSGNFNQMYYGINKADMYASKGQEYFDPATLRPTKYATNDKLQSLNWSNAFTFQTTAGSNIVKPSLPNLLDYCAIGENITMKEAGSTDEDIEVQVLDFLDKDHVLISQSITKNMQSCVVEEHAPTWIDL